MDLKNLIAQKVKQLQVCRLMKREIKKFQEKKSRKLEAQHLEEIDLDLLTLEQNE